VREDSSGVGNAFERHRVFALRSNQTDVIALQTRLTCGIFAPSIEFKREPGRGFTTDVRLEVCVMSIDSLTTAAIAAGYAMAASEELLGEQRLYEVPEPSAPDSDDLCHEPPRVTREFIVRPRMQPAIFDWLAFWRVPA
jgi:hypothetical protein